MTFTTMFGTYYHSPTAVYQLLYFFKIKNNMYTEPLFSVYILLNQLSVFNFSWSSWIKSLETRDLNKQL